MNDIQEGVTMKARDLILSLAVDGGDLILQETGGRWVLAYRGSDADTWDTYLETERGTLKEFAVLETAVKEARRLLANAHRSPVVQMVMDGQEEQTAVIR
jgi:hypothetical protein